jgi:AraC family transcriptional regulator
LAKAGSSTATDLVPASKGISLGNGHTGRSVSGISDSEQSMRLLTPGTRRYPTSSALLASSGGLGWTTMTVELRYHDVAEAPTIIPEYVEVCLVIDGNRNSIVRRTVGGQKQEAAPRTGAIWLSPAGVSKDIAITSPIPQTMHLYLPVALFHRLKEDFNLSGALAQSIHHAAGINDDVIYELGRSILSELTAESSVSRMYAEIASLTIAARLLQKHSDGGSADPIEIPDQGLDRARLNRVLDYIAANIGDDITLSKLAEIAGYSPFHFARKFAAATGVPPHRYIGRIRLQNAMAELAGGNLPLAQIALNAHFSSQASFTRAFHRATGMTPKQYRRRRN